MKDLLILDTHTLLWLTLEPTELGKEIRQKIESAKMENCLAICSISLWEIAMLISKKRVNVFESIKDFLKSIAEIDGLKIKDISPEVAAESMLLMDDFHGDPADRLIVATTKVHGATLLTRDKAILKWAKRGYIKFIKI